MTKRGTGTNCFNNQLLRRYYDDYQPCFGRYIDTDGNERDCGRYDSTDFHHNVPRNNRYADSPLNAVPICRRCHSNHSFVTRTDNQQIAFEKVVLHLVERGYKFTELDYQFVLHNEDKFHPILLDILSRRL